MLYAVAFLVLWSYYAFNALTLLVGREEGHPACKNWVVRCWHGYLSEARCRFAYGPADAIATHYLLLQQIQIGFTRMVLLFWCQLTQVVLEKRPLNEYSTSSSSSSSTLLWSYCTRNGSVINILMMLWDTVTSNSISVNLFLFFLILLARCSIQRSAHVTRRSPAPSVCPHMWAVATPVNGLGCRLGWWVGLGSEAVY